MIRQFSAWFKSRELADSHRRSNPKKSGFAYCAGETDDKSPRLSLLSSFVRSLGRRDARIRWCPVILWKTLRGPPRSAHSPINSRSHIMRAFMSGIRREITSRTGYIRHADNSTPLKRFSLFSLSLLSSSDFFFVPLRSEAIVPVNVHFEIISLSYPHLDFISASRMFAWLLICREFDNSTYH